MSCLWKKIYRWHEHQHMCYSLIPRKDKEGSSEVPLGFLGLLIEYGDVISNNVIEGLLPIRKISHQIDLVLELVFLTRLLIG